MLISGNTPRAVLYGTYAFIEKFFRVRWFAPGELYEHCPSNKKLVIPDSINTSSKPEFTIRNVAFIGCNWNSDLRESWKFLARSRFQVRGNIRNKKFLKDYDSYGAVYSGGGHTLAKLIPDTLFETHPEYFALVKGRRIKQISEKGQAQSQPCTSNPEVTALAIKGISEYFDNAPAGKGKFKHELKKYSRSTSVSSKAIYHFTFELATNEKGYFYILGKDIIIENIAAAFNSSTA